MERFVNNWIYEECIFFSLEWIENKHERDLCDCFAATIKIPTKNAEWSDNKFIPQGTLTALVFRNLSTSVSSDDENYATIKLALAHI